jgi:hypothetical protein
MFLLMATGIVIVLPGGSSEARHPPTASVQAFNAIHDSPEDTNMGGTSREVCWNVTVKVSWSASAPKSMTSGDTIKPIGKSVGLDPNNGHPSMQHEITASAKPLINIRAEVIH